jgi:hypothetical protein
MELVLTAAAWIAAFLWHVAIVGLIACAVLVVGGIAAYLVVRGVQALDALNVEGWL